MDNISTKMIYNYRKIRAFVKLMPYLYIATHIFTMLGYLFLGETASTLCDISFYTSPFAIFCLLVLSRLCNLCKWHKTACILPLVSFTITTIDSFVYRLTQYSLDVYYIMIVVILIATIVSAYHVFIKTPTSSQKKVLQKL